MNKYTGSVDDFVSLRAYLAGVMMMVNELKVALNV